jgi:3-methyladenine DNA glycosylase AlkD
MQRYMRSEMAFYGVPAAEVAAICRGRFRHLEFRSAVAWSLAVLYLWRHAKFREERYAAVTLSDARSARRFQTVAAVAMYEEMIVSGAWWDYVDVLAVHRIGPILREFPGPMRAKMRVWARSDDLWKRRSAILSQVGFRDATDRELLYECIEPSLASREFFLRKAIGWALRQYARTDPDAVRSFVARNEGRLSPLSRREALRRIVP